MRSETGYCKGTFNCDVSKVRFCSVLQSFKNVSEFDVFKFQRVVT